MREERVETYTKDTHQHTRTTLKNKQEHNTTKKNPTKKKVTQQHN